MVLRRCAMTTLVRPASSVPSARWIEPSVRVSMFAVASSRIRMRGSASTARAKATQLPLALAQRGRRLRRWSSRSRPGRRAMKSCASTARAAASTSRARGRRPAVGDVVGERAGEQERLLRAPSRSARAALARVTVAHVVAVDEHAPVGDVVEARDEAGDGGLAGAGLADERHRLPGRHLEADVAEDGAIGVVGERARARRRCAPRRSRGRARRARRPARAPRRGWRRCARRRRAPTAISVYTDAASCTGRKNCCM